MSTRTISLILILVGMIILAFSLLADLLGIGRDPSVFGPVQIIGAAIGLVSAAVGVYLARK